MKRVALLCSALLFLVATPQAQAPPEQTVGIINIEQAIIRSNEGQSDFAALQKRFAPKQDELRTLDKELEDLKKQLHKPLYADVRADLERRVEQKEKNLQRFLEDAQTDIQNQQKELANQIGRKILVVLDKYAKDNGFTLIYDTSQPSGAVDNLLWADAAFGNPPAERYRQRTDFTGLRDLTGTIVDLYNRQSGVPATKPIGFGEARQVPASRLSFVVQPPNVQVYIDDTFKGMTSPEGRLVVEGLASGSHRVRMNLIGYTVSERTVELKAGETATIEAKLDPAGPKPLALGEIEEALTNGLPPKGLNKLVNQYGVDFTLTREVEQRLRSKGADDALLVAIATNKK